MKRFIIFAQNLKRSMSVYLFASFALSVPAQGVNDSIDIFQYQTVISKVTVQGRDTLEAHNVTIAPTGQLKLSSPKGVVLSGPFVVQLGGILELNGGYQYPIHFSYDGSGNVTCRRKEF